MSRPVIFLGADHNGYRLKELLKQWLVSQGITVRDTGAVKRAPHDDYPVFAATVANAVSRGKGLGLLMCGSGHGMAIAANKFPRVRAALCTTPFSARMARHDDHANILALAAWETTAAQAKKILAAWLKTIPSRVARHRRRVAMIEHFR